MCAAFHQGHRAEGPPVNRVAINHGVFIDAMRGAHDGHVQPVEVPVFEVR